MVWKDGRKLQHMERIDTYQPNSPLKMATAAIYRHAREERQCLIGYYIS
jgi:hypothetical protein